MARKEMSIPLKVPEYNRVKGNNNSPNKKEQFIYLKEKVKMNVDK
jgi:hypothetical protein